MALGVVVGLILGVSALGVLTWMSGCGSEAPPPGPSVEGPASAPSPLASLPAPPPVPDDSNAPEVAEPDLPEQAAAEEEKPWEGPWLGALAQATPIYPTARFSRNRLGYIRRGGKVPVKDSPIKTASCKQGFYPLIDGGYVCGKYATTNMDDARVKMGVKQPDLEAVLPYRYAYNNGHGTPLYISVPSREDMMEYEPYLADKGKKKGSKDKAKEVAEAAKAAEKADQPRPSGAPAEGGGGGRTEPTSLQFLADAGTGGGPPAEDGSEGAEGAGGEAQPSWWQKGKGEKVDVTLADLNESDGTISKRMVKGFFIAIDSTFGWNDRMWYKTTDGLIAPADRMIIPKTPELGGHEIGDGYRDVGFVTWKNGYEYEWPEDAKAPKRTTKTKRFQAVGLTGKTRIHDKERYRETVEGWWMKDAHGTYTDAAPRPSEVGADEKWIDVNLTRKTLVAFVGDKPVFATLVSPGKRSSTKARDHRTKVGSWRIREKHISTTMDGDGPAGDLPYSIQDVPYVQYYDGSYALHGAFWHNNFGREQSHGCVNLSPADAKYLFGFTEPHIPRGWHGVWSSDKRKGTLVNIHE